MEVLFDVHVIYTDAPPNIYAPHASSSPCDLRMRVTRFKVQLGATPTDMEAAEIPHPPGLVQSASTNIIASLSEGSNISANILKDVCCALEWNVMLKLNFILLNTRVMFWRKIPLIRNKRIAALSNHARSYPRRGLPLGPGVLQNIHNASNLT